MDYALKATHEILSGSNFSPSQLSAISAADYRGMVDAVGGSDFYWPWFNECLAVFKQRKKWPDSWPWSWFRVGCKSDLLTRPSEVLAKMKMAQLKLVAGELDIPLQSKMRVAEVRETLGKRVRLRHLEPYTKELNTKIITDFEKKRLSAKCCLLYQSIGMRARNIDSHLQVSELAENTALRCKGVVVWDGSLGKLFKPGYRFTVDGGDVLPPFYPGESTRFTIKR